MTFHKRQRKWIEDYVLKVPEGKRFSLAELAKEFNMTTRGISNQLKGNDLVVIDGVGYRRRVAV